MEFSTSPHRPPHLYTDGEWYFITASTVGKTHILVTEAHFNLWEQILRELTAEFGITLVAWAALPNHYHLLFLPKGGHELGQFMKHLNGHTSRKLNLLDQSQGRSIWYSYWDTCIRDERGFWRRFNYIHYNPVKHGYVKEPEEWQFSSYRFHLREESPEWMAECLAKYRPADQLQNDVF